MLLDGRTRDTRLAGRQGVGSAGSAVSTSRLLHSATPPPHSRLLHSATPPPHSRLPHSATPLPHSRHRNRARASAKRLRSRGAKRLAASPRIGGLDSQPRPSGPTKPGGPQEPGAGRHAMCPGEEDTRRQPHRPDGRGLFAAIPVPRLDRGQKPAAFRAADGRARLGGNAASPPQPQTFPQNLTQFFA